MLTITKSTNLNGTSSIDGNVVATMYANISKDNCNQNVNITNNELYEQNKTEIRNDITKFNQSLYELQDGSID
ncbi:MAG: hypothetical protein K2I03_05945 [Lachnospiraceae bacterium]|nr:hypothetical protein [Lachnospiraceae bacterium]